MYRNNWNNLCKWKVIGQKFEDLFTIEMPLYNVDRPGAIISTICGAIIGILCSLIVNCTLVEISLSPFFAMVNTHLIQYFGSLLIIVGFIIIWRLNSIVSHEALRRRTHLRLFALSIILSGLLCFILERNWFTDLPLLLKTIVYTIIGISVSFALTFSIVDIVNYFIGLLESTIAKPLVESKSQVTDHFKQVYLVLFTSIVMGAIFGFIFGLMDVEDELIYHMQLTLLKEEHYCYPIGAMLGGIAGFGNEYLRQQELFLFHNGSSFDEQI